MFDLDEIKDLIHDAAVDGHLDSFEDVQVWLKTMSKLDKDILLLIANEYWDKGQSYDDTNPSEWGE